MKSYRYITLVFLGSILLFSSCEKSYDAPAIADGADAWQETMSIAGLKSAFDIVPPGSDGLFTVNPIESDREIIVKGRVTSQDNAGNIYKYIVIEDFQTKEALRIAIDAGSLSGIYPMGQELAVKCNGLILGRYADAPQLGVKTYRADKDRVEPGRIPERLAATEHIQAIGMPDTTKVVPEIVTVSDILKADSTIYNRLVTIRNVYFTMRDGDGQPLYNPKTGLKTPDCIFAPSTFNGIYNVGYPQSRQITDGTGVINIATSEYARFASDTLPNGQGDLTAIVGWFKDKVDQPGDWQLTIRSLNDLGKGFRYGEEKVDNRILNQ